MLKTIRTWLPVVMLSAPLLVFAQTDQSLQGAFVTIRNLISVYIIPFLFSVAIVYFLWGVIQYITKQGDEAEQQKARGMMIWGVIAIAVMAGIWGLVNILTGTFGIGNVPVPTNIPNVPVR